jgi:cytochrome c556
MRTFTKAIVIIGSAVALTAGTALAVSADEGAAIKYRQAVMKAVGGHMGGSVAIIKGKVPYEGDLVAHARGLNDMANIAANAFKQKTEGGKTRAKPDIWKDGDDFSQKIADLKKATAAFLAAAESGGAARAGAKLGAVGDSCKGCHKKYRAKKS